MRNRHFSSHNHSMFSNYRLLDAINRPEHLFDRAIEIGLTGFAITDHETLSGHVRVMKHRDKLKADGELPEDFTVAFGNEAYLVDEIDMGIKYYHWLIIAKDRKGHDILRKLSSLAWDNSYWDRGMERVPLMKRQVEEIMEEENGKGHLIVTSACLGGELGSNALEIKRLQDGVENGGNPAFAEPLINELKQKMVDYVEWNEKVFGHGNFFIELAPNDKEEQMFANEMLWNMAKAYNIKAIFATDSHYLTKEDQAIHRALLNSKDGEREVDDFYSTAYLMETAKVYEFMSLQFSEEQFDEMVDNLEHMRSMIEDYTIFRDQVIPVVGVEVPVIMHPLVDEKFVNIHMLLKSDKDQDMFWIRTCLNELYKRGKWNEENYLETLEKEAEVIVKVSERLGQTMSAYYNTARRLIEIMWNEGDSLIGVSRGSAMAFLSNWLLDITQVDPIPYQIPFWRHLSADRPELPDIDIDSQGFKREQIINAMKEVFGTEKVLNICTYGTEGTKSAIATAARGLGIDNDVAMYLTGMVPNERGFDWSLKDMVKGNAKKDRRPVYPFIEEIMKYPKWLDTAMAIEGLITRRGSHAAGVYFFNGHYTEMNAMMKAPNGLSVTQWDMNESDMLGGLKFDFLSIEGLDKIRACMDLLIEDELLEWKGSLKETYDDFLHPDVLDYDAKLWEPAWEGRVLDLFQFQTPVGGEAIKKGKPTTVIEGAALNSLMRLMPMEDGTVPTDKFVKFKENLQLWYDELKKFNIPEHEIPILERHYLLSFGVPNTQEEMMILLMDEEVCNFSVIEANVARKIVGKKQMEKIPGLRQKIFDRAVCSEETIKYIWNTAIGVQMGYSFSLPHTVAYTIIALQELNLYNKFPSIYWNTACLVVNSGDEGSSTDYAKIASAIGSIKRHGVDVELVDINESGLNFTPNVKENHITYGLKAVVNVGDSTIQEILNNRPYDSMDDFIEKVNPDKSTMVSLIKAGAFDKIEKGSRRLVLAKLLKRNLGSRKQMTLANVPLLAEMDLIGEEVETEYRIYEFNRYVKTLKKGQFYIFNERAERFYLDQEFEERFLELNEETGGTQILVSAWDKIYDKAMQPMRDWMKANVEDLIEAVGIMELVEEFEKYGKGTVARWEMDSVCFYHSAHELAHVDKDRYGITGFDSLPRVAPVKTTFKAYGKDIPIFHLSSIVGTVIGKNKVKGSLSLLTPEGDVIMVKMNKEKFSHYDRQISENITGNKKQVLEKSWFGRGNLLMITGYRRDDQFIPKAYKDTPFEELYLITEINQEGELKVKSKRG